MIIGKKKHFCTPILLLTWRREESLKFIINKLREINAKKIYVSSDGFRNGPNKNKDIEEIISTRELLLKEIDWPCNVKFNFNYSNLGCKVAVSSAIDWFFDKEISGIILEEDCIPNDSFFYFCENILNKYKNEEKVQCITGVNFQEGNKISNSSYYFSKYNHCWGWATWKSGWELFDRDMKFWPKMKAKKVWNIDKSMSKLERKYWDDIFEKSFKNKIDSWAYPWLAALWNNNKLTITPEYNLVSNKGFDGKATHTKNRFSNYANMKTKELEKIIHNENLEISIKADRFTFKNKFSESFEPNIFSKIKKKINLFSKIILNPKKGLLYLKDRLLGF